MPTSVTTSSHKYGYIQSSTSQSVREHDIFGLIVHAASAIIFALEPHHLEPFSHETRARPVRHHEVRDRPAWAEHLRDALGGHLGHAMDEFEFEFEADELPTSSATIGRGSCGLCL